MLSQKSSRVRFVLIAILVVSAFLRLVSLSHGDQLNDEGFFAFRAIGMIDFFDNAGITQTPPEWLSPASPWWLGLSFHDHPPLIFWIQHIFMKALGEHPWAYRLPSAIFGIASIYLLFLIAQELFSPEIGLLAATLLGLTANHVYISRVGMQESAVIFFLLLATYTYLKSLVKESYLLWFGVAIGLGALIKYSVFLAVPICLTHALIFHRAHLQRAYFWLAGVIGLILFSPVILYNAYLYKAVGHFDLQFSYILGEHPAVWANEVGKNIGTISERAHNFFPTLVATNSWAFLILFGAALAGFLYAFIRQPRAATTRYALLIFGFIYIGLFLLLAGPSIRFLTLLTPLIALSIAISLSQLQNYFRISFLKWYLLLLPIWIFEILFSLQTAFPLLFTTAQAQTTQNSFSPWYSRQLALETYDAGYNELDQYFDAELAGKRPALTFEASYPFMKDIENRAENEAKTAGLSPHPVMIIYAGNYYLTEELWIFNRRSLYHGWPVIKLETNFDDLKQNAALYDQSGFSRYYFVAPASIAPDARIAALTRDIIPGSLTDADGKELFRIYKFARLEEQLKKSSTR